MEGFCMIDYYPLTTKMITYVSGGCANEVQIKNSQFRTRSKNKGWNHSKASTKNSSVGGGYHY